jgi:hypothetical protein
MITNRNFWFALASTIVSGASFWAPNVALFPHIRSMDSFFVEVTFACPAALLATYALVVWLRGRHATSGPFSALFGLIGVWVTGPWLMALAGNLAGARGLHKLSDYAPFLLMSVCPPLTFYFAFMQGNIFALILATILMPVCHRLFEKGRWLIPPGWKRRLQFRRRPTQ